MAQKLFRITGTQRLLDGPGVVLLATFSRPEGHRVGP
jgi:hypothetical protein